MANRRFVDPAPFPTHHFKAWREYRGLSQAQVEQRYNWPKARVSNLENGRATITGHVLLALARAYRCTVADLVGRDPKSKSKTKPEAEPPPPKPDLYLIGPGASLGTLNRAAEVLVQVAIEAKAIRADVDPRLDAIERKLEHATGDIAEALRDAARVAAAFEQFVGTLRPREAAAEPVSGDSTGDEAASEEVVPTTE